MNQPQRTSSARQRIVETAESLFYAHGVRAVGIDRIIAEAGVAKMTLYNHFKSKDDLILAVLQYREQVFDAFVAAGVERHTEEGLDRLRAFFATLKDWFESPGFRGCSFINAAVELADHEHPASQYARQHKVLFRNKIEEFVRDSAGDVAAVQAPAIALMIEGAIVTAVLEGASDAAQIACDGAGVLIDAISREG